MYQQAMSLLDERCISRHSSRMMAQIDHRYTYTPPAGQKPKYSRSTTEMSAVTATRNDCETPLLGVKHHPYGVYRPDCIYVHQRKPTPMEPLPVSLIKTISKHGNHLKIVLNKCILAASCLVLNHSLCYVTSQFYRLGRATMATSTSTQSASKPPRQYRTRRHRHPTLTNAARSCRRY